MRPVIKQRTSPVGFQYRAVSEIHKVQDTINSYRRFEPESFNASRMAQPDLFRIEQRSKKDK
jgi:hypothetical protein